MLTHSARWVFVPFNSSYRCSTNVFYLHGSHEACITHFLFMQRRGSTYTLSRDTPFMCRFTLSFSPNMITYMCDPKTTSLLDPSLGLQLPHLQLRYLDHMYGGSLLAERCEVIMVIHKYIYIYIYIYIYLIILCNEKSLIAF